MAEIGKWNTLRVIKQDEQGLTLDGESFGELGLPHKFVKERVNPGDTLEVFLFIDSEDRVLATTVEPLGQVGEFALLRVVDVTRIGAFLDWGLPKDLFVPLREQRHPMEQEEYYIVRIYIDEKTGRVVASSNLNAFLEPSATGFAEGQKVSLLLCEQTELGYKAIVDNRCWGLLYENEVFQEVFQGDLLQGYVKKVRDDGKLDLSLHPHGYKKIEGFAEEILQVLTTNQGFLPLHDKSSPAVIAEWLGMSKKNFKKAIGGLYKQKLIDIGPDGIRLNKAE